VDAGSVARGEAGLRKIFITLLGFSPGDKKASSLARRGHEIPAHRCP